MPFLYSRSRTQQTATALRYYLVYKPHKDNEQPDKLEQVLIGRAGNLIDIALQLQFSASDHDFVYLLTWIPQSEMQTVIVYQKPTVDAPYQLDPSRANLSVDKCRLRCKVEVGGKWQGRLQFYPCVPHYWAYSGPDRVLRFDALITGPGSGQVLCSQSVCYVLNFSYHDLYLIQRIVFLGDMNGT